MVAFLQFSRILSREVLAASVKDDNEWQTEALFSSIFCNQILVVSVVYINQHNNVVGLQCFTDRLVTLEKLVQLMAPATPIRPELQ